RLVGVGVACYTEYTGMGADVFRRRGMIDVPGIEAATVTMGADGTVSCVTSFPSQGQGHATTIAQLVADRLGISMDAVRVLAVDTLVAPRGSGTFGSRGAVSILGDRKSTRLNSSHGSISYAVFCLKKKKKTTH